MPSDTPSRAFSSDNWAGVHPEVVAAIVAANSGHASSYGFDDYTRSVVETLRGYGGRWTCEV